MTVRPEPVQYGEVRAITTDEGIYLIRDVRYGFYHKLSCQYGIRVTGTRTVQWLECEEGVDFQTISPFFLFPKNTDAIPAHSRPRRIGDARSHEDIHD
jgi:hypothetical protein